MKKIFLIGLCITLLFNSSMTFALEQSSINAQSAILMDSDTGSVLYSKSATKKMFPASTTKLLTALIILENHKLTDQVTIDELSPKTEGSRIYILPGEQFSVESLLYALMLESANDVAQALAIYHSGSIDGFAVVMNKRATDLGAKNSHFTNPHGLPDDKHYTTAYDLALIAKKAVQNKDLLKITSTYQYDLLPTNKQPEVRHLTNSNKFLYGENKYEFITGLKTGYTTKAGQCYVGSITKNGRNLISVILNTDANNLYSDTRKLMDYGTDETDIIDLYPEASFIDKAKITADKSISLFCKDDIRLYVPKNSDPTKIEKKVILNKDLKFPIDENKSVATLSLSLSGKDLGQYALYAGGNLTDGSILGEKTTLFDKTPWYTKEKLIPIAIKVVLALFIWRVLMTLCRLFKRKIKRLFKKYTA